MKDLDRYLSDVRTPGKLCSARTKSVSGFLHHVVRRKEAKEGTRSCCARGALEKKYGIPPHLRISIPHGLGIPRKGLKNSTICEVNEARVSCTCNK